MATLGEAYSLERRPEGQAGLRGASGHKMITTHDVDQQSALLKGWNQTYDQMSSGRFSGSFQEADLDGLYLFREVTSVALYQSGCLQDDLLAVGIPLVLKGLATFCGQLCRGAQLHLFSGQGGFEFNSPSDLDIVGISLPWKSFIANLQDEEVVQISKALGVAGVVSASPVKLHRLCKLVADIFELFAAAEGVPQTAQQVAAIQQDLREALLEATLPEIPQEKLSDSRKARLIREARRIAAVDQPENPVTIEELCKTLGVSRRTLQYGFIEMTGMPPATYLRLARLNGARRSLKAAASVTEVATVWGFWHLGRFSQDYKAFFGETPSFTLQRTQ